MQIREIRKMQGMKVGELAKKCYVSEGHMKNVENGTSALSGSLRKAIADATGIPANDIEAPKVTTCLTPGGCEKLAVAINQPKSASVEGMSGEYVVIRLLEYNRLATDSMRLHTLRQLIQGWRKEDNKHIEEKGDAVVDKAE